MIQFKCGNCEEIVEVPTTSIMRLQCYECRGTPSLRPPEGWSFGPSWSDMADDVLCAKCDDLLFNVVKPGEIWTHRNGKRKNIRILSADRYRVYVCHEGEEEKGRRYVDIETLYRQWRFVHDGTRIAAMPE